MKIRIATLLFGFLFSLNLIAQVHKERPLPQISDKAVKTLDEGITGWSFSRDGQWISREMNIPPRAISTNTEVYESNQGKLGLDNISELKLFSVKYGEEDLVALVKTYTDGGYEFQATQRGWEEYSIAYYFVFNKSQLQKLTKANEQTQVIQIPLRDFGTLGTAKKRDVREHIKDKLLIKDTTERVLSMTIKKVDDTAYFQFASMHKVFDEVEGVLEDFKIRGSTIYGTPRLLEYLHYSYNFDQLLEFFDIPAKT